jgi:hypothetical protein
MPSRASLPRVFGCALIAAIGCGSSQPSPVNQLYGAAGNDAAYASNDGDELASEPGARVYDTGLEGRGSCSSHSVEQLIELISSTHPEVMSIREVQPRDGGGDGDLVIPFLREDGGFAFVFKRGEGDCLSGCISNEYWYFETRASCAPAAVGHYLRRYSGECYEVAGEPMWGWPGRTDPVSTCNEDQTAAQISGSYQLQAIGKRAACATANQGLNLESLTLTLTLTVAQSADPSQGSVSITGTGHPLIDGRSVPAKFTRQRFAAQLDEINLPSRCPDQSKLSLSFDFEGISSRHLYLLELHTPDCVAAPDDYCKGFVDLALTRP